MSSTDWQLFIDESGNFRAPGDRVCVAGVLLPIAWTTDLDEHLRNGIARLLPLCPYPPHTTVLNLPASRPLFAIAARGAKRAVTLPEKYAADIDACADALRAARDPEVLALVESVGLGVPVDREMAETADAWLQRDPSTADALQRLRGVVDEDAEQIHQVFEALANVLVDQADSPCAAPVVVVAAEATPPERPSEEEPRYLDLLATLLERVVALLRSTDGNRRHVVVHVAGRPLCNGGGKRQLTHRDLADAARVAAQLPFLAPTCFPDPAVWLSPMAPCDYDDRVPAGIVLADFVANRTYQELKARPRTFGELEQRLQRRLGRVELAMRPLAGASPLPAVASGGLPRSHVARALAGQKVDARDLSGVDPAWASAQAQAWQAAAPRLRGAR